MKQIYPILASVFLTASVFAQPPEKMSYQAVIRTSSGELVADEAVSMQISILQSAASGTEVYVETHNPITNANGLVSIEIGGGTVQAGDFTTIDWTKGSYFIKTETDLAGGTNYTIIGTSQLLSVPYALHAKTAETISGAVSNYYQFAHLNVSSEDVYEDWTPLGISATDEVSFTKVHDDTNIEVIFNSRVFGGTFIGSAFGIQFSVTINDNFPDYGTRGAIRSSNTTIFLSFTSIFENLSAGTYSLKVVARSPNTTDYSSEVLVDPGGWGGGMIVKEVW